MDWWIGLIYLSGIFLIGFSFAYWLFNEIWICKKRCKTCKYWNFKVSGSNDICWGQCLCNKKMIAVRISLPAEYQLAIKNSSDKYIVQQNMKFNPYDFIDIYFNENEFGCIHYKSK